MAIITSPDDLKKLDPAQISRRLALAEGLSDDDARKLAAEGKAVVWIDGGLHATETVGSQQLMERVYQMVSRPDPETQRFLNDVILLCVQVNPDGQDLVSNWYMRNSDPKRRSLTGLPRLYGRRSAATTTIATSTCLTCRKPSTRTAFSIASGFPKSCTTITRPVRAARWSSSLLFPRSVQLQLRSSDRYPD